MSTQRNSEWKQDECIITLTLSREDVPVPGV